jgi:hypothetical protein
VKRLLGPAVVGLVTAAAGLAACGGGSTTVEVGPPVSRDFFGMNAQLVEQAAQAGKLGYADRQTAQIAGLGVGFVRSAFDWTMVEPSPPAGGRRSYDFSSLDGWVATLARHHLRWLATVKGDPIPRWAAEESARADCGSDAPPRGTADYAALMTALARRYGRGGSFWSDHPELPYEPITGYEVWNEPNFGRFWCPRPDPASYARLYLSARTAVHAVDPRALVLVGGLAPFTGGAGGPPDKMSVGRFLAAAVHEDPAFGEVADAVAVHPYGATPGAVMGTLRYLRATLDSSGLGERPMLADEVGWHTRGTSGLPPVPEEQRAADFRTVTPAITRSDCDVIGLAAHTWVTPEQRPTDPEDWYGMADALTGAPYPSAIAYGEQVKALEAGAPVAATPPACGTLTSGGGS